MSTVRDQLNSVFQDVFDDSDLQIQDTMTAKDVDGWDSVTHISLVVAVEGQFKIRLSTAEVASLKNVGEMVRLIEGKLGRGSVL